MQPTCSTRATHVQHTCNTRATHEQHNVQHEHFCCKFPWFSRDGVKFAPFPFEVALGRRKWPESHYDCKFTGKVVLSHLVLHVCCIEISQSIVWATWNLARIPHWNLQDRKPTPYTCSVPKDILHAVGIESVWSIAGIYMYIGICIKHVYVYFCMLMYNRCDMEHSSHNPFVRTYVSICIYIYTICIYTIYCTYT